MGNALDQSEGLEGQHGDHLSAEVAADDVDDCDHEDSDHCVTLEGGEGHLLAEGLQLRLDRRHLLLVPLALRLDDVRVLQLLQLFVELFDFGYVRMEVLLLMR